MTTNTPRPSRAPRLELIAAAVLYYTILCYTILHYTILYYAILCYAMLFWTMLYYMDVWNASGLELLAAAGRRAHLTPGWRHALLSEGLTRLEQSLNCKGRDSSVHREFPGNVDSQTFSLRTLSAARNPFRMLRLMGARVALGRTIIVYYNIVQSIGYSIV